MKSINQIVYVGIVIVVSTVTLWLGAELTKRIEWIIPYTGGVGVALICGGFFYEIWRRRK
jgi:hypothetical protein